MVPFDDQREGAASTHLAAGETEGTEPLCVDEQPLSPTRQLRELASGRHQPSSSTPASNPNASPGDPQASGERDSGSLRNLLKKLAESSERVLQDGEQLGAYISLTSPVGKILANKYEVLEKVGQGGMGSVFRARDILLDRLVAIKLLNPSVSSDERSLERFHREAQLVSRLNHPNAIEIYEFGVEGPLPFLVMEFVDGLPLEKIIKQDGPMDFARAAAIIEQVADALASAHQAGIIHRDLKPDNIMISTLPDGSDWVRVLDFGMAKLLTPEGPVNPKLSSTGVPCGTPHYMSPELVKAENVDIRADIYALGVIAFQMLAGKTPFEDLTTIEILFHQFHTVPPPISQIVPQRKIPDQVEAVIARSLEKLPENRQQTALEFSDQFTRAIGGEKNVVARRAPQPSQARLAKVVATIDAEGFTWWDSSRILPYLWRSIIPGLIVAAIWASIRYSAFLTMYLVGGFLAAERIVGHEFTPLRSLFRIEDRLDLETLLTHLKNSDVHRFRRVLIGGFDPNTKNSNGQTPLHIAATLNFGRNLAMLLEFSADPTITDEEGITPLHIASARGATGIAYQLIDADAVVDARNKLGQTPLHVAVKSQQLPAVHALLGSGAAVNATDDLGESPLMIAAGAGNLDLVRLLLDRGAAVHALNLKKRTPIFFAVDSGSVPTLELLIQRGATIDARNDQAETPLMAAVRARHYGTVEFLLQRGADARLRNAAGETAVSLAEKLGQLNLTNLLARYSQTKSTPR